MTTLFRVGVDRWDVVVVYLSGSEADEVITAICMKRRLVFERMYFFMCADAMEEIR
jgi:hypothetical protein